MKKILSIHRYLGLITGLFIIVIGLTGSVLVYGHNLQPSLRQQWHQVHPKGDRASFSQLFTQASQTITPGQLDWLDFPRRSTDPVLVRWQDQAHQKFDLYLNPYTLEILGQYPQNPPWMRWVNHLHTHLLVGKVGHWLVGCLGLMLLVLSLTGLPLWNGWKKLTIGFKIRWQSKRPILTYDLHKVGGILAATLLILLSATGSFLVFEKPIVTWLGHALPPMEPLVASSQDLVHPPKDVGQSGNDRPPSHIASSRQEASNGSIQPDLDTMLALVQSQFPDAQINRLHWPKSHG